MTGQHLFVAVSGNIGAGKSSLARLLGEHFHWKPYYESVDNNPYLADFYADMPRWSFHLQVYFISNSFKGHKEIVESNKSVIQDRTIYEDAEIFARNLYAIGRMTERDFEKGIERVYLERLNVLYNDWIARYKYRLLIIESDHLDFVNKKEDHDFIVRRVKESLPRIQMFEE